MSVDVALHIHSRSMMFSSSKKIVKSEMELAVIGFGQLKSAEKNVGNAKSGWNRG